VDIDGDLIAAANAQLEQARQRGGKGLGINVEFRYARCMCEEQATLILEVKHASKLVGMSL
jgi:hypothetical protein